MAQTDRTRLSSSNLFANLPRSFGGPDCSATIATIGSSPLHMRGCRQGHVLTTHDGAVSRNLYQRMARRLPARPFRDSSKMIKLSLARIDSPPQVANRSTDNKAMEWKQTNPSARVVRAQPAAKGSPNLASCGIVSSVAQPDALVPVRCPNCQKLLGKCRVMGTIEIACTRCGLIERRVFF